MGHRAEYFKPISSDTMCDLDHHLFSQYGHSSLANS